jgi:hypothetical protein
MRADPAVSPATRFSVPCRSDADVKREKWAITDGQPRCLGMKRVPALLAVAV